MTQSRNATRWALAALAAYAVVLLAFRPATPLEWDEVLALRALDRYDVGAHAPQPPGFPAFIAAAKAVKVVVGDPVVALQIVVILSALACVAGTWALARRLGAPVAVAAGAAAVVAANPEFLFSATVGISDVPGTAASVLAALALVAAAQDPGLLPAAGAVCGAALGVRPQDAVVWLPALAWAVAAAVRARRWGRLAAGAAVGLAVTAAFWVPAVLATGPNRWWAATLDHRHYLATVERFRHLPGAPVADILRYWFLDSFMGWAFAIPLWLLVIGGTVALARRDCRRAAALAGSCAGLYLLFAWFTMNETVSLRYLLPATPFIAILAGGALAARRGAARAATGVALALWCVAAAAWTFPALRERLKPEPVWAALEFVQRTFDPARTRVVFDGVMTPHVQYVLASKGFRTQELAKARLFAGQEQPGEQTVFVTPRPVPGAELLFEAHHDTARVLELAWHRYGTCAVSRMKASQEAVLSAEWQLRSDGWLLAGTGRIRLPAGATPALVRLCAGSEGLSVKRPGAGVEEVSAGRCELVPLLPGEAGEVEVSAPAYRPALIPAVQLLPLEALRPGGSLASAYMVPQVAHVAGYAGAFWRTDLVVMNPTSRPLRLAATFLPTDRDNSAAASEAETVAPGSVLNVPDVLGLARFRRAGKLGAMLVRAVDAGAAPADECGFLLLSRTYNSGASPGRMRSTEWLPGVRAADALRPGDRAEFTGITNGSGIRASVGLASWSAGPVRAAVRVFAGAKALDTRVVNVPPFGHRRLDVTAEVTDGRVEVRLLEGGPGAMLVPYVSMVDQASGLPAHLLPDEPADHPAPAGWSPPLPRDAVAP